MHSASTINYTSTHIPMLSNSPHTKVKVIKYWLLSFSLCSKRERPQLCTAMMREVVSYYVHDGTGWPKNTSHISKVGCHMGGTYDAGFGFPDDLKGLAPIVFALLKMINICVDYDIIHNENKSKIIIFKLGRRVLFLTLKLMIKQSMSWIKLYILDCF